MIPVVKTQRKKTLCQPKPSINIGRIERREWFLWSAAVIVTLLLTAGLASFLVREPEDVSSTASSGGARPRRSRAYSSTSTPYTSNCKFTGCGRKLIEGEELFRLITENAADMIASSDMEGNRVFNSLSYEKVLGYSLDELKRSSPLLRSIPRTSIV